MEQSRNAVKLVYRTAEKEQSHFNPYQNEMSFQLPDIGSLTPGANKRDKQLYTFNHTQREGDSRWINVNPRTTKNLVKKQQSSLDPIRDKAPIVAGAQLSIKVIEEWITETLENAEEMSIAKKILK